MKSPLRKNFALRTFESILVIGFIIFEELIWNTFAKPIIQYLDRLKIFAAMKDAFVRMNRHLLLTVFLVNFFVAEYLGILSGIKVVSGDVVLGIVIYSLKIPIAAFTFWLFKLTKDKLMSFHWLKVVYEYTMNLMDKLINSSIHVYVKSLVVDMRKNLKEFLKKAFGEGGFYSTIKMYYTVFKSYLIRP